MNSNINTGGGNLIISGEMTLDGYGDNSMKIAAGKGAVLFKEKVDIGANNLSVISSNLTQIRPGAKFSGTSGQINLSADQMILIQEDIRLTDAGSVKMLGGSIFLAKDKSIVVNIDNDINPQNGYHDGDEIFIDEILEFNQISNTFTHEFFTWENLNGLDRIAELKFRNINISSHEYNLYFCY